MDTRQLRLLFCEVDGDKKMFIAKAVAAGVSEAKANTNWMSFNKPSSSRNRFLMYVAKKDYVKSLSNPAGGLIDGN